MIDSEFNGNDELSEELVKAGLKNGKRIVKATVKKLKEHPDKKESKLKFKEEQSNCKITVRKT